MSLIALGVSPACVRLWERRAAEIAQDAREHRRYLIGGSFCATLPRRFPLRLVLLADSLGENPAVISLGHAMPRKRKVKAGMRVRRSKCATCVFRDEQDGGICLTPERREEIAVYLLSGANQLCHHDDNKTICRGGRLFELQCWARMGLIEAPTDAALRKAMKVSGVKPRSHV